MTDVTTDTKNPSGYKEGTYNLTKNNHTYTLTVSKEGKITCKDEDDNQYVVDKNYANLLSFQKALRDNDLKIEKYDSAKAKWEQYDLLNTNSVNDRLYTEDDAAAEAKYYSEKAKLDLKYASEYLK